MLPAGRGTSASRPRGRVGAVLAGIGLVLSMTACANDNSGERPTGATRPSRQGVPATEATVAAACPDAEQGAWPTHLVLARSTLENLRRADPAGTGRALNRPSVYITGRHDENPVPPGWSSVPTANFKSYAEFRSVVEAARMHPSISAVLYDPEGWSLTPLAERRDVVAYMERFSTLARAHGWKVILTPSNDLMNLQDKLKDETNRQAYVRYRIAEAAARHADILEVQAQTLEQTPSAYREYVRQTRTQAVAANPRVVFLSGLTTNLQGTPVSGPTLYDAATSVRELVDGFFLNVPRAAPSPANGVTLLRMLSEAAARPCRTP
jgi:hypothetical protein